MTPFKLRIITPEKTFFDGETEHLILRTAVGEIGILAKHESYVSVLPPGAVRIKINGKFKTAAISQGVVKVSKDRTIVIATSIEWADEIDVERAKHSEQEARNILAQKLNDMEVQQAEFKLQRALNRLLVSSKKEK